MTKFGGALALVGVLAFATACSGDGPAADVGKRGAHSDGPVIATGTVRKAVEGKPTELVSGATVTLTWTSDRDVAKSGATVEPEVVAKATTDDKGRYTVRGKPPAELVKTASTNDGIASISVLVEASNGDFTTSAFTRQIVNGAWGNVTADVDVTYRYTPNGNLINGRTQ